MFRISSLPARDQLFQPRDLVTSPPPGAPGTESAPKSTSAKADDSEAVVVDLSPAMSRQSATEAVKAANAQAAANPGRDMKALGNMLRDAARQNASQMVAAQAAPDATRVANLLFGN